MSTVYSIFAMAILVVSLCHFRINIIKLCEPLSQLDLSTLLHGSVEERTQRNK